MVQQTGDSVVEVSWLPPLIPPRNGYLIMIADSRNLETEIRSIEASSSPHRFLMQSGKHQIRLRALSEHYPSNIIGPVNITVRSKYNNVQLEGYHP